MANVEKVELSQGAVSDYVGTAFRWTGHYAWELAKLGIGVGLSVGALSEGYGFVKTLPVVENIDALAHQIKYLPQLVSIAAPLFTAWKAKEELVDNGLAALKKLGS